MATEIVSPTTGNNPNAPAAPKPQDFMEATEAAFAKAFPGASPAAAPAPPPPPKPDPKPTTPAPSPTGIPDFAPKPAATTPVEDDEPETSPRATQWKELKRLKADLIKENAELKSKMTTQPAVDHSAELAALKKSHEEMSARLQQVAIERHPQFEAAFKKKQDDLIHYLNENVQGGDKLAEILALPSGANKNRLLEEILTSMSEVDKSVVGSVRMQFDQIDRERKSHIANSAENFKAMQAYELQQKKSEQNAFLKVFDETAKEAGEMAVFKMREGDKDWNDAVAARLASARNIVTGQLAPKEVAKAAHWAVAAPVLLSELNRANGENEALKARLAKLEAGIPNPGKPSASAAVQQDDPKESFGDRIARMAREKGGV